MSERINASICLTDLGMATRANHSAITTAKNGKVYANITIWVNDEKDKFDNDVSIQLNSKQDQRESDGKVYIGNGKTARFVSPPTLAPAPYNVVNPPTDQNDLPF